MEDHGIISFLTTQRDTQELRAALAVIRDFQECENVFEFMSGSSVVWAKVAQLEEFLAFLVEGGELQEDTIEKARECGITATRRV